MSRGPGKWQRAILAELEAQPEGAIFAYIPNPDTGDVPTGFPVAGHSRTGVALKGALCDFSAPNVGNAPVSGPKPGSR